jgi:hypothetical protein
MDGKPETSFSPEAMAAPGIEYNDPGLKRRDGWFEKKI